MGIDDPIHYLHDRPHMTSESEILKSCTMFCGCRWLQRQPQNGLNQWYDSCVLSQESYIPLSSDSILTLRAYSLGDMPVACRKRREK